MAGGSASIIIRVVPGFDSTTDVVGRADYWRNATKTGPLEPWRKGNDFAGRGWQAQNCFIKPDETAIPAIERFLVGDVLDCVVIGAGVRLPRNRLVLFEAVVNAIHRMAPHTVWRHTRHRLEYAP